MTRLQLIGILCIIAGIILLLPSGHSMGFGPDRSVDMLVFPDHARIEGMQQGGPGCGSCGPHYFDNHTISHLTAEITAQPDNWHIDFEGD